MDTVRTGGLMPIILQPKLQTHMLVINMYHVLSSVKAVLKYNDACSENHENFVYKIVSMEDSRRMVSEDKKGCDGN